MNAIYTMNGQPAIGKQDMSNLSSRLARVESVVPYFTGGGNIVPTKFSTLDASGVVDGKLNLAVSSSLSLHGMLSPNVIDGQFSVAKPNDNSAVIYWDGTNSSRVILIRRADSQGLGLNGTSTTVPPNNITITGLTHDLTYQILPYWSPANTCGIGFAPGTVGTPQIAFLSTDSDTIFSQGKAIQSLIGREPLGNVSWTMPASGGSGGAGPPITPPPRNPGTCVMLGTNIKTLGGHNYDTQNYLQEDWVRIESEPGGVFTRGLNCTPNHWLFDSEQGRVQANFFVGKNRWIITEWGEEKITNTTRFIKDCTKQEVKMREGHLYFANGYMSHNMPKLDLQ